MHLGQTAQFIAGNHCQEFGGGGRVQGVPAGWRECVGRKLEVETQSTFIYIDL